MNTAFSLLSSLASTYDQKNPNREDLIILYEIKPALESWYIIVQAGQPTTIAATAQSASQVILSSDLDTLEAIISGKLTGLTAMGRENLSDDTPLDFRPNPDTPLNPAMMARLITFVQRFFNPSFPEKIELGREHARLVHGAWAIPMFYHTGMRSAWYELEKGQRLNGPGDTNPFPQAFVIIKGKGQAKFGDFTGEVQAGQAYYIPPATEHILWNESDDPLNLIFLAWGEGA